MDLKETDTLPVIIITMLSILVYYAFSKDRALDKKLLALEKGLEQKCRKMKIGEGSWKRCQNERCRTSQMRMNKEKFKTWQHGLQETQELTVQEFIGQDEQQREGNVGWRQEPKKTLEQKM